MRKTKLLNRDLSYLVSDMGHFDRLAIGDAGLPVPGEVPKVDLAVCPGVPSFLEVLGAVLDETQVQRAVIASEMEQANPGLYKALRALLQEKEIAVDLVPHERFKRELAGCKAVVRTGECTPFANVILESGVTF